MSTLSDWRSFVRNWAATQNVTGTEDESSVDFGLEGACAIEFTALAAGPFLRLLCVDVASVDPDKTDVALDYCNAWNAETYVPTLHVVTSGDEPVMVATAQLPIAASISQPTFDEFVSFVVGESMRAIDGLHKAGTVG